MSDFDTTRLRTVPNSDQNSLSSSSPFSFGMSTITQTISSTLQQTTQPFVSSSSPATYSSTLRSKSFRDSRGATTATPRPSLTNVQVVFRLGLMMAFNGACYGLIELFSRSTFARMMVLALNVILVSSSAICVQARDWHVLRVLAGPTLLTLGSELGVAMSWFTPESFVFVAGVVGFVLTEATVLMAVCGPNPRSTRVQFVTSAIGLCAPLAVSLVAVFSPTGAGALLWRLGIMSSLIASSANLLFNKI